MWHPRHRTDDNEGSGEEVAYSSIKKTEVLVRNFENTPERVSESEFVGVAQIHFNPLEVSIMINNQLKTLSDAVMDCGTCSTDYHDRPPPPKNIYCWQLRKKYFDVFFEMDEVCCCNPLLALF